MLTEQSLSEATYRRYLADLQGWVGWFALVRGDQLGGIFPTYETAATAWMSLYGPVPALIRRIERTSSVAVAAEPARGANVSRNVSRYVQTIAPADAEARLTVSCAWAISDARRKGDQDFAA